jgi:formate dehydrogenase major subunit
MNSERRIQRVRKVIEPLGESLSDWEILCRVARAMGQGDQFAFKSDADVWNEIRAVWPAGAGISYKRLEAGGLQWPCPSEDHPGTSILHKDIFSSNRRPRLRSIEYRPTDEQVSAAFPFLLITGRGLYQFNAGTMTGRSKTAQFQPRNTLQISAEDAGRLAIASGQNVRVVSRFGEAIITATISDAVRAGELFTTFQSPDLWINFLTGPHRDRFVHTPEYKVTAVRIEAAG